MTYFRFTLTDYTFDPYGQTLVIDEPNGFDGFKIQLARDLDWHGIFSDYTLNEISVIGEGFNLLDEAYNYAGIEAHVLLTIEYSCEGCSDDDCFTEVYRARIDFGRSTRDCGTNCEWNIVLEPDSCINTFRSRYDTKVNLDATTSFDGTALETYPFMGDEIDLPGKAIRLYNAAESEELTSYVITDSTEWPLGIGDTGTALGSFLPMIPTVTLDEIPDFYSEPTGFFYEGALVFPSSLDTIFTLNDESGLNCLTGEYTFDIRVKGRLKDLTNVSRTVTLNLNLVYGPFIPVYTVAFNATLANYTEVGGNPITTEFDETISVTIPIEGYDRNVWLYFFLNYNKTTTGVDSLTLEIDDVSYINIQTDSLCDPTPAKTYLIHETLSHISEAITDGCMKVKSEYYGRTDSQPFAFASDGCGSLRCFTNGLLIRQALMQDGSVPPMVMSMKESFDGLKAIDCIGMGTEIDPATDDEILRIEPIKDFYSTDVVMTLDNNGVTKRVNENQHFAKIRIGYDKWEAEEYNGLDEFLTKREYRTNLTQTAAELVQLSNFIASGYAIEITRRKGASTEDWRYDNDLFIICLERSGVYASSFEVEQGNISNDQNIISPSTIYNYRISPVRNLLRWLWYVLSSYRNQLDPNAEVIFTAGDGNFVAKGIMTDATCRIESAIIQENADLNINSLSVIADGTPIWYNETDACVSPLAYDEFVNARANQYGLFGYYCNDELSYGWLQSMEYDLKAGQATFNLIPQR